MSNNDKNIVIQPNRGQAAQPKITFAGQENTPITLSVLDNNTISFDGYQGQLFAISHNLASGTIFSVNDISGIPSIRVNADGTVGLAEFGGNVGIGITNPTTKLYVSGVITGAGLNSNNNNVNIERNNNAATSLDFNFLKSRGTPTAKLIVQSGDQLGTYKWRGYDGSTYQVAAAIKGEVDGTPGAGDMPGRLVFYTTPDGSSVELSRLVIDSNGNIGQATSKNTDLSYGVTNTNAGTAAEVTIAAVTSGTTYTLQKQTGAGFTTAGLRTANQSLWYSESGNTGGTLVVNVSTAPIMFAIGGIATTNERARIGNTETVFNDPANNYDFRIEGDTEANLFFVDASVDRIGIGTNTPTARVQIVQNQSATTQLNILNASTGAAGRADLSVTNSAASMSAGILSTGFAGTLGGTVVTAGEAYLLGNGTHLAIEATGARYIRFATNTLERMRIISSGEVGIGTSTPNEKLTVEGVIALRETTAPSAITDYGKLYVKSTDSNLYFKTDGGSEHQLTPASGGANTALSNLAATAINTSLLPGIDDGYSLGSPSLRWRDGYFANNSLHVVSTVGEVGFATDWNMSVLQDGYFSVGNVNDGYLAITRFGNVGIGTTYPANKLEVDGYVKAQQGFKFGDGTLMTTAASGGSSSIGSVIAGSTPGSILFIDAGALLAQDPTQLFWDNPNNRLGLGTNTPSYPFHLRQSLNAPLFNWTENASAGTAAQSAVVTSNDSGAYTQMAVVSSGFTPAALLGTNTGYFVTSNSMAIYTASANPIVFGTNTVENMRLTSGGDIGIGTATPGYRVHAFKSTTGEAAITTQNGNTAGLAVFRAGTDGFNAQGLLISYGSTHANAGIVQLMADGSAVGDLQIIHNHTARNITFRAGTAQAERMRISSAGNVGIGSNSVPSMFNVGATNQFQVDSSGNIAIAGIAGIGTAMQATVGLTVKAPAAGHGIEYYNSSGILNARVSELSAGVAELILYSSGTAAVRLRPTGTIADPDLVLAGDTDTGILHAASDTVSMVTGGFEAIRFAKSNAASFDNGVILMGTTTIGGTINSHASVQNAIMMTGTYVAAADPFNGGQFVGRMSRGTKTSPTQVLANDSISSYMGIGYHSGGAFYTANANAGMHIHASEDYTATAGGAYITFRTVNTGLNPTINANYTEKVRISPDGYVGILNATPAQALHVAGNLKTSGFLEVAEIAAPSTPASGLGRIYAKSDNLLYFKNDAGTEYDLTATGGGGGANTSLSNLVTTAINADLLPTVDDAYSLGSPSLRWKDGYFANNSLHVVSTSGETGTATDWNLSVLNDGYLAISNINDRHLAITRFGNVGIGTTNPTFRLTTNFSTSATNTPQSSYLLKTTSTGDMADGFGGGQVWAIQDTAGVENLIAGVTAVRAGADNTGRLFIRTTVAGSFFERASFGPTETVFNDPGENLDFRIEGDNQADLFFLDASTDRIGIGTNTPATKFHIWSGAAVESRIEATVSTATAKFAAINDAGSAIAMRVIGTAFGGASQNTADLRIDAALDQLVIATAGSAPIAFHVTDVERMRINTTGVGIGTTNPNEKLTIEGVASFRETTAPSATANYGKTYVKSSDNNLYFKTSGGTEHQLTPSSGGGGANTSLSNLVTTVINAALIPAVHDGYDIGTNSTRWQDGYFTALHTTNGIRFNDGSIQTTAGGGSSSKSFVSIALNEDTDQSSYVVIGAFAFDASEFTTKQYRTVASVTSGGLTGDIQLYNVTDTTVVATHSYAGDTSPTLKTTVVSLPSGEKIYEIRHRVTGGSTAADRVATSWAGLKLS